MSRAREEFEGWARRAGINLSVSHDGTYIFQPAYYSWLGWTARTATMIPNKEVRRIESPAVGLGRKGGQARSECKAKASRANGRKGGRPRAE